MQTKAMHPGSQFALNMPHANRAVGLSPQTPEPVDYRGYFKVETYPNNSVIYRPGDPADKVYLLRSGRVRLIRVGKGASRSVLAILRPGDLFGEMLRPEGAQVEDLSVASGEAEVWSIDSRSFQQLLESRPHLAVDVLRALHERLRQMRRRVLGVGGKFLAGPDRERGTYTVRARFPRHHRQPKEDL